MKNTAPLEDSRRGGHGVPGETDTAAAHAPVCAPGLRRAQTRRQRDDELCIPIARRTATCLTGNMAANAADGAAPEADAVEDVARTGLELLRLLAEAADRDAKDWVNRRMEQLEFLDTRAVRWRVSVDFDVPAGAPTIVVGGTEFRLVPLTSWNKADLVAFDLRDEAGNALWMPNSEGMTTRLVAGLSRWASVILNDDPPIPFPEALGPMLEKIVSSRPPERLKKIDPFMAVELMQPENAGMATNPGPRKPDERRKADEYDKAIARLRDNYVFFGQLSELWRNYLIVIAVADPPGKRRVIKLAFESEVTFRKPKSVGLRLVQNLGWRSWRLDVYLGGRGGSHHLEVAAPAGIDIVQIRIIPAVPRRAAGEAAPPDDVAAADGGSPHVHIRVPARHRARYRATILVRVSRPGWLTNCWLAGVVIFAVLLKGRTNIAVLFPASGAAAAAETGTAATLLLALLAVFATMLAGPGAHPLASRLLMAARFLILIDSGAVLVAVGNLLLDSSPQSPPVGDWTALTWSSGIVAILLTLSRLLPKAPRGKGLPSRLAWTWIKNLPTRIRNARKAAEGPRLDRGGVTIPAADGYHFGDDHSWSQADQACLVTELERAEQS